MTTKEYIAYLMGNQQPETKEVPNDLQQGSANQVIQPDAQPDKYQNTWGFDNNQMQYLEGKGWDKNRLEALSKFDPNRNWNEQFSEIEKMKPQYTDGGNGLKRSTWGAIGDSMKLLAQLGGAFAGAYIQPNKESLTDYFVKMDERDKERYLRAMNQYQIAVNQARHQNQKNNYSQYQADRKELASILSNKERLDERKYQFETNQKRLSDNHEEQKSNWDRNYDLRKRQVDNSIYNSNKRTQISQEREKRLANSGGKGGEKGGGSKQDQMYYDRIYHNEVPQEYINSLPESYFDIHFDKDGNPVKKLKNSANVRRLIVEGYLESKQNGVYPKTQKTNPYDWNSSVFNPENNPNIYNFNNNSNYFPNDGFNNGYGDDEEFPSNQIFN